MHFKYAVCLLFFLSSATAAETKKTDTTAPPEPSQDKVEKPAPAKTGKTKTDSAATADKQADKTEKPKVYDNGVLGITIGYTHNFVTRFIIKYEKTEDSDEITKAHFEGSSNSPYLTITTGNFLETDNHMMFIIEAGYSRFELNTQEYDGIKVNYGTSVEGSHTYIMPQFIYSTSDIGIHPNKEHGFRFGGGIGIGVLKANGTAVYTDKATRQSADVNKVHTINFSEFGPSIKLFAEYRFYGLILSAGIKSIVVFDSDDQQELNDYALTDFGVNLAYSWHY